MATALAADSRCCCVGPAEAPPDDEPESELPRLPLPRLREPDSLPFVCLCGWVLICRPRPLQCSQVVENDSSNPEPRRLRVICTNPSEVTSATWWRVRSRARH